MAITRPVVSNPFADTASGSPDIAIPTYMDSGFPAPGGVPVKPPRGYINWLFNWCMQAGRYLLSRGIGPWAATETQYTVGSVVTANDGNFYVLRGAATTGLSPFSDLTNWFPLNVLDRGILGDYLTPIAAWRNVLGIRGFIVDHLGFPAGQLMVMNENWTDAGDPGIVSALGTGKFFNNWSYLLRGTGSGAYVQTPGAGQDLAKLPWGSQIQLSKNNTSPGTACIEGFNSVYKMTRTALSISFWVSVYGVSNLDGQTSVAVGLSNGTVLANTSDAGFANGGAGPSPVGVAIYDTGMSQWASYARATSGSPTTNPTGVSLAMNNPIRVRFDILGDANSGSDDGTARVKTYINGVVVNDFPIDMNGAVLRPFIRIAGPNNDLSILAVGPMQIRARLSLNDDAI